MLNQNLQLSKSPNHTSLWKLYKDFSLFSRRILRYANQGVTRNEFMREAVQLLLKFSDCDAVEIRFRYASKVIVCHTKKNNGYPVDFHVMHSTEEIEKDLNKRLDFEYLCAKMLTKQIIPDQNNINDQHCFRTGNAQQKLRLKVGTADGVISKKVFIGGDYQSVAIFPFTIDETKNGLVVLKAKPGNFFSEERMEFYKDVAQTIGLAALDRRAQEQLRERVKELTCLYQISGLVEQPDISVDCMLQGIVDLLPEAWRFPDYAAARIILDGKEYTTKHFAELRQKLSTKIIVDSVDRGSVEVIYVQEMPELDDGPFLKEEKNLINEIARQIAHHVERKQREADKKKLQEQLRHADRLATIGQLAAGVAHELNEPLGSILGFAQLSLKNQNLPDDTTQDLRKIVKASLHAREVVKKLMYFAREMPPSNTRIDLNHAINEGLYFLASRCAKHGVELIRNFSPDLPEIIADISQIQQVLINLVVNAIQAMPGGGKLVVETAKSDDHVVLVVKDTGIGMSEEEMKQIFVPFFTTKDINEGTGLGLSVVHGIVTAHNGSIQVKSKSGYGSSFEIRLPIKNT